MKVEKKVLSQFVSLKLLGSAGLIGLAALNFSAHSAWSAEGTEETGKVEGIDARAELDEFLKLDETAEGKVRVLEMTQKMKITSTEFVDFFKAEKSAGRLTKESSAAWAKLLSTVSARPKTGATATDFENADLSAETLGSYIKLRKSGLADNLDVREASLVDVQKTWTTTQRANFAKTLKRAAELSQSGQYVTAQDAFEKALDEQGYLEKYKKGCSR